MTNYPEHEKMSTIVDKSQAIGEFLEWIRESKKFTVCVWNPWNGQFSPIRTSIDKLLAEYFEIDLSKIEQEKQNMLEEIRRQP
jgi:hypothetical protein